jgi:ribosomal protein S18 acetylase RimI-like enzyme
MTQTRKIVNDRIELRPVKMPDDDNLLKAIYYGTRDDTQMLPEEFRETFLLMQYEAQKAHYSQHFNDAHHYIVTYNGKDAGRYWAEYRESEIRVIDIALLDEFRGSGIGSAVLRDTMKQAAESGRPCTLHAMQDSRELNFYEKLGFRIIGEEGMHRLMEWKAETDQK